MIGKYLKLILAVACVFIFALSLTVSIAEIANACPEPGCCFVACPEGGFWKGAVVGTTCRAALPGHCCYQDGCL
jgi:hypothetical protein